MQDEVNYQVVAMILRAGRGAFKLSDHQLRKTIKGFNEVRQKIKEHKQKNQGKPIRGKQSLSALLGQDKQVSQIDLSKENLHDFNRIASKYGIDFSIVKDSKSSPPVYYAFFKAQDAEVMTAAFKEYTASENLKKEKPSVRARLANAIMKIKQRVQQREKDHKREEPML